MGITPPNPIDPAVLTPEWARTIVAAHTATEIPVSHAARIKSDRYFVWQEEDENDLASDNLHAERAMSGYTDLFTKVEFDAASVQLETAFDQYGISWSRTGVTYEPDTGFFHWSWDWEVPW